MPLGLSDINRPYVEGFQRTDGLYDYRLVAGNGKIVVSSFQGYTDRGDAERAMRRDQELFAMIDFTSDLRWAS